MGFFQYSQTIPIQEGSFPFPVDQIYDTGTDALVYLTIDSSYQPWDDVTDAAIDALAKQCADINKGGRQVLLRFWPEMNGNWFAYGQQPVKYVAMWKKVYNAVKAQANQTYFLWSPSNGVGYPYTPPVDIGNRESVIDGKGSGAQLNRQEYRALDTNNDGTVDSADDRYSPFYPGDEYVDWVGLSMYWYSLTWQFDYNSMPTDDSFTTVLNAGDFYNTYAVGRNRPFAVSETAAAYHLNNELRDHNDPSIPNPSELEIKQKWWRLFLTNKDFLTSHEKMHLISLFEYQKDESADRNGGRDVRDFRITTNPDVLKAFLDDFKAVQSMFIEAVNGGEAMKNASNAKGKSKNATAVNPNDSSATSVYYGIQIIVSILFVAGLSLFV